MSPSSLLEPSIGKKIQCGTWEPRCKLLEESNRKAGFGQDVGKVDYQLTNYSQSHRPSHATAAFQPVQEHVGSMTPLVPMNSERIGIMMIALRKSMIRRLVLRHLASIHPEASHTYEIARQLGLSPTQVYGAVKGLRNHYEPKNSLLNLGLAEAIPDFGSRVTWYRATTLGCSMTSRLESKEHWRVQLV